MNNDQLFEKLGELMEFSHKVPDQTIKVVSAIVNSKKPIKPKVLGKFGSHTIHGKSHTDLLVRCVELLERVKYLKIKETIKLLLTICKNFEGKVAVDARKALEHLSQYNLNVLKQVGYKPQEVILEQIAKFKPKELKTHFEEILPITEQLLKPSFEGTSMQDYKTFTFHFGALNAAKDLIAIRQGTIAFLKKLYDLVEEPVQKKKVIEALEEATRRPEQSTYGEDLIKMIIDDTNTVISFYIDIIDDADNLVVKSIEQRKNWFIKWGKRDSLERIDELEAKIASKTDYGLFRTFVGYDYEFSSEPDWDKAQNQRTAKIHEFIDLIEEANLDEWKDKIKSVVKVHSADKYDQFQYFTIFLFELSKKKPNIAFELLKMPELAPFVVHIIAGLWKSSERSKLVPLLREWIEEGKSLNSIAFLFSYVEEVDIPLMKLIVAKAKKNKDYISLTNIVDSISRNYGKSPELKEILLGVVLELGNKLHNETWLHHIWFRSEPILKDLNESELDTILEALLTAKNINYEAETLLAFIAEKYPVKIINFFEKRVSIKADKNKKWDKDDRYDAIPYDFKRLAEALKKSENDVIPALFKWYGLGTKENRWLYHWEASNLLSNIFPQLSPALQKELLKIIKGGKDESLEVIYSFLGKYEGEEFLYDLVEEIVKAYKKSKKFDEVKGHLFGYLSQTGVVGGEYGFVEALTKKKEAIAKEAPSRGKEFQAFAKEYSENLDKRIDFEKKRADEEIELRKSNLD